MLRGGVRLSRRGGDVRVRLIKIRVASLKVILRRAHAREVTGLLL